MLRTLGSALLVVLVVLPGLAEEKKATPKKPIGTWLREVGDNKLLFTFKEGGASFTMEGPNETSLTAHSAYGVTEDNTLFGIVTMVEKKGVDNGPEKGQLFSFTFKIEGDTMTVSDLNGTNINDDARNLIHGDYKKQAKGK
jgi:hypothetical protein